MKRRRVVAIAAAGLAVAAGGGAAIAATTTDDPRQRERAVLNDAAERLGVTPEKLRDALGAAQDAQLDAAVAAGELTQEQADALKARRARSGLVLGGPGLHGGVFGHGPGIGAGDEVLDAAAEALGLTRAELLERFRAGDTVGEIAEDEGVAIADVRAAVRAAARTELDEAVQAGRLSRREADRLLDELVERIEDVPGDRGFGHRHGPGFGFGPGPGFGPAGEVLDAAAKALGISSERLVERLRDGESLADIAADEGVAIADVRAAARAAAKAELDEAVDAGRLTRRQADELLDAIAERIERFPAGRRFGHRP
jgi:uncharacterized protein (DUF433 family)